MPDQNSTPVVVEREIKVPLVSHADGYPPTSFGVNLSGKAAHGLLDYISGLHARGETQPDPNAALNRLLEQLA